MSKLNKIMRALSQNDGSTLVLVVVFSLVFTIAGLGYLLVMSNTVSHEVTALDDERAYQTAESGIFIGARWLRDTANWNAKSSGLIFTGNLNDMTCSVRVDVNYGSAFDTVTISSSATGGILNYRKILSLNIIDTVENFGTFINSIGPYGGVGGGGLSNFTFDGPVHANVPIYLSAVSNPTSSGAGVRFLDRTSVHNHTDKQNFSSGGHMANYGESNNNYGFGIWKHSLNERDVTDPQDVPTGQSNNLDGHFASEFAHSQDSLFLPSLVGQDTTLPYSPRSITGEVPYLLYTAGGGATYHYYNPTGDTAKVLTFPANYVDGKIIRSQNDIGVLGVVSGQTTLVTDDNQSIYPLGDLVYDDFSKQASVYYDTYDNSGNFGVGSSDNLIALVSGGDIYFNQIEKYYEAGVLLDSSSSSNNTDLFLTASLIAENTGYGTWWKSDDGTRDGKIEINKYEYRLHAIGDRIIDRFYCYDAGGTKSNTYIRFYHDVRFTGNFRAPGVPVPLSSGSTGSNGLIIFTGTWSETNIPL